MTPPKPSERDLEIAGSLQQEIRAVDRDGMHWMTADEAANDIATALAQARSEAAACVHRVLAHIEGREEKTFGCLGEACFGCRLRKAHDLALAQARREGRVEAFDKAMWMFETSDHDAWKDCEVVDAISALAQQQEDKDGGGK